MRGNRKIKMPKTLVPGEPFSADAKSRLIVTAAAILATTDYRDYITELYG
jgi:hypothetical protein